MTAGPHTGVPGVWCFISGSENRQQSKFKASPGDWGCECSHGGIPRAVGLGVLCRQVSLALVLCPGSTKYEG